MLRYLGLAAAPVARPLLDVVTAIAARGELPATDNFLRPHSKWRRQLRVKGGRRIEEQYGDTGGFTDHLFGISGMLGYRLVLRIRDLPSKRLYVFDPAATPSELRPLVGGKAREALIVAYWPDLFRCVATMSTGQAASSRILRKLTAYPCQNDLAVALREAGRIERTLFIIEWLSTPPCSLARRSASTRARRTTR